VYLYRQQKRVLTSSGKKESVVFLDFAYSPSNSSWEAFCSSLTLAAPNFDDSSDASTSSVKDAHYMYGSGSSCYKQSLCTSSQTDSALEWANYCNAEQTNGYPSMNFCGYNGGDSAPYKLRLGCEGGGCDTLVIQLPAMRKQRPSRLLSAKMAKREAGQARFLSSCEYADEWLFGVKF
jgi:hypothetical protein